MTPNNGPKKAPKVSIKDRIPICLKKVSQKIAIINPAIEIITLELFKESDEGIKFMKEYCEGIKLAIKLVEADAIIIKIKAKLVKSKLSNFPIMSVGFVNIFERFSES